MTGFEPEFRAIAIQVFDSAEYWILLYSLSGVGTLDAVQVVPLVLWKFNVYRYIYDIIGGIRK